MLRQRPLRTLMTSSEWECSFFFENAEGDCGRSEQLFCSTSVFCSYRKKRKRFCGRMRAGTVLYNSGSERL